jgi:hypothetical protein
VVFVTPSAVYVTVSSLAETATASGVTTVVRVVVKVVVTVHGNGGGGGGTVEERRVGGGEGAPLTAPLWPKLPVAD